MHNTFHQIKIKYAGKADEGLEYFSSSLNLFEYSWPNLCGIDQISICLSFLVNSLHFLNKKNLLQIKNYISPFKE